MLAAGVVATRERGASHGGDHDSKDRGGSPQKPHSRRRGPSLADIVKAATADNADPNAGLGSNSLLGKNWCAYWKAQDRNPFDEDLVPEVEVAVKFLRISDVNSKDMTFDAELLLMLDWVDPSLELETNPRTQDQINWKHHFCPLVEIQNMVGEPTLFGGE